MMILSVTTRALTWKYLVDPERRCCWCAWCARSACWPTPGRCACRTVGAAGGDHLRCVGPRRGGRAAGVGREMQSTAPLHRMSTLQDLEAGRRLEIEETLAMRCGCGRLSLHCRCSAAAIRCGGIDRMQGV